MAQNNTTTIDNLPIANPLAGADRVPIEQGIVFAGTTTRTTLGAIATFVQGVLSTGSAMSALLDAAFGGAIGGVLTRSNAGWINGLPAIPRSYLAGLTLSNDGISPNTVVDIAAGQAADSTNVNLLNLNAFTKAITGPWVVGNGSPGMGNGVTAANNTWYHTFLIVNAGSIDIYFDTSVSGGNAPSGTTLLRRIGAIRTDNSGNIRPFSQNGDEFLWKAPLSEYNNANVSGNVLTTVSLSGVPANIETWSKLRVLMNGTQNMAAVFWSPDMNAQGINIPAGNVSISFMTTSAQQQNAGELLIRTNTSNQINFEVNASGSVQFVTFGWVDRRGRDN